MLVDCGISRGKNITVDSYKDMFLVREQTVERIFSNNTSINRFVISKAMYDNWTNNSKLYSINTDDFFMTNPRHKYLDKKSVKFGVKNIGKVYRTDSKPAYFEKHYRENMD